MPKSTKQRAMSRFHSRARCRRDHHLGEWGTPGTRYRPLGIPPVGSQRMTHFGLSVTRDDPVPNPATWELDDGRYRVCPLGAFEDSPITGGLQVAKISIAVQGSRGGCRLSFRVPVRLRRIDWGVDRVDARGARPRSAFACPLGHMSTTTVRTMEDLVQARPPTRPQVDLDVHHQLTRALVAARILSVQDFNSWAARCGH